MSLLLSFSATKPDWTLFPRLEENDVERELKLREKHVGFFIDQEFSPQAFIVSPQAKGKNESNWPDVLLFLQRHSTLGEKNTQILGIYVQVTRPESVGEIGLNTAAFLAGERNDTNLALIDFKQFSRKHDVDAMIEGKLLCL